MAKEEPDNPFGVVEEENQPWRWSLPKGKGKGGGKGGAGGGLGGRGDRAPAGSHSVFVANISFRLDEDQLGAAFSHCGEILNVRIIVDEAGKKKGFGFIDFKEAEAAEKALDLNGKDVGGRPIKVAEGQGQKSAVPAGERKAPQNQLMGGSVSDCWFCLSNPEVNPNSDPNPNPNPDPNWNCRLISN